MGNYHYIIAGLPDLLITADNKGFSYDTIREQIYLSSDCKDKRFIEWLEFGTKEENLNSHFYKAAFACKNHFIRAYYMLDLEIRNRKVDFIQNKLKKEGETEDYKIYPKGYTPIEFSQEEIERLNQIFATNNILEKEQMLDRLKWDFISSFNKYGEFNMNVVLAFLAKGTLINRWNKLDKKTGEEMFKRLVDEVRGTFTGINLKEN